MKKLSLTLILSLASIAAYAAETTEMLVTIAPAHLCYKAIVISVEDSFMIQGISVEVPCGDESALEVPVFRVQKFKNMCAYRIGRFPGLSRTHQKNGKNHFNVVGQCPAKKE